MRRVLAGDRVSAAGRRRAPAGWDRSRGVRDPLPGGPRGVSVALRHLRRRLDVDAAPHVVAHLVTAVGGDLDAVVATARSLTAEQLAGASLLPDPLPAADAVVRALDPVLGELGRTGRTAVLVASVSVVDRTEVLLRALGTDLDGLLASPAARHLGMVAGRVWVPDPRLRSAVHGLASIAERTAAHRALLAAHAPGADGADPDAALWHTALSTLAGDDTLVTGLLALAARLLDRGDAVTAQRVAREAAAHAVGAGRARAVVAEGMAALHAGHVADAARLLGEGTTASVDAPAVAVAACTAVTLAAGDVPDVHHAPDAVRRAAAVLTAERGDAARARRLLAPTAAPDDAWHLLASAALDALAGEVATAAETLDGWQAPPGSTALAAASGTALAHACRAVALAAADRFEDARSVLAAALAGSGEALTGHAWPCADRRRGATPLVEAYVRLADAVVATWSGDVGDAAHRLEEAALRLPVALPGAGLAGVLLPRLGLVTEGRPTGTAEALERLVPARATARHGLLVTRATASTLAGAWDDASTALDLAEDVPPGAAEIPLPGIEPVEVCALAGRSQAARAVLARIRSRQPAAWTSATAAARARAEILGADDVPVAERVDAAEELVRTLRSPLERARTTLVVARLLADAGSVDAARRYRRAAAALFEQAGATQLARVARAEDAWPGPAVAPAHGSSEAWAAVLTTRERDVVRVVTAGASNREAAAALGVSERTVEVHLTRIFRKLGTTSRLELAVLVNRAR